MGLANRGGLHSNIQLPVSTWGSVSQSLARVVARGVDYHDLLPCTRNNITLFDILGQPVRTHIIGSLETAVPLAMVSMSHANVFIFEDS